MRGKLIFAVVALSALMFGGLLFMSRPVEAGLPCPGVGAPTLQASAVPGYTRKLPPPPGNITPVPPDPSFRPAACLAPVVNVSQTSGNDPEGFVVVNPTNPNNIVSFSNLTSNSIFRAYSFNGGVSWTRGTVATGAACCDAQAAFDTFGNLFPGIHQRGRKQY